MRRRAPIGAGVALAVAVGASGCRQLLGIDPPVDVAVDAPGHDAAGLDAPQPSDAPSGPGDAAVDSAEANVPMFMQGSAKTALDNTTSLVVTLGQPVERLDLIVVVVGVESPQQSGISVKDSLTSSYATAVSPLTFDDGTEAMYFATTDADGSDTITVSLPVLMLGNGADVRVADYRAAVFEGSGWQVDATAKTDGTGADAAVTIDVTAAALVVGADGCTTETSSAGSGFAQRVSSLAGVLEDELVDPGPLDVTVSLSGSASWILEAAAFRVE